MKRVACYLRVSTVEQSVDLQRRDQTTYCSRHEDWTVTEYIDNGISGSKDSRPALDRMMQDIRQGKVDIVIVWRYDRFARSLKHLVDVLDELRTRDVQFVSVTENVDTNTASGRLMFGVIASFAEFERGLIVERVRAGQQTAKAKGKVIGRKLGVLPEKVQEICSLRASGHSFRQIAASTGVPRETARRFTAQTMQL
jgi:DNA invertase Pin-like site-specific DNA recombinase